MIGGMSREELNAIPCTAPDLDDETEHFMLCPECGQAVDMRRLGDVLHHDKPGHVALPTH